MERDKFRENLRKKRRRKNLISIAFIFIFLIILFNIYNNRRIKEKKYELSHIDIPASFDGYRILQVSDLYGKEFGKSNKKLISKINAMEPHAIFFTGNIISMDTSYEEIYEYLTNIRENIDENILIYYSPGKEETYLMEGNDRLENIIKDSDYVLLRNKRVQLVKGGEGIYVTGFEIPTKVYEFNPKKDKNQIQLSDYLNELDEKKFNIALSNNPDFVESYSSAGYDLVLSGYKLGGTVRLPLIGGLYDTNLSRNLSYQSGKYWVKDSQLIVSKGLGQKGKKIRLFNAPEIINIELKAKKR